MGDDERGEFLYRYVSNGVYAPGGETDTLLEDGKLYAAKFNDDGSGEWRELSPEATGMKDMAEICIHTRLAASAVGATTMDRPEWVGANPKAAEVYCCLTNMFNSPDGLKFDSNGLLWIQTDGNYSNESDFAGQGNNQMLAGDPATGEIRRFLTGPKQAEVTGLTWSPDRHTMFVGIQHPGERGSD